MRLAIFSRPTLIRLGQFALLMALYAWLLNRVRSINPAILGDEWVYLVSSRHYSLWSPEASSLGNYMFNFVYKSTLLCGENFYFCAKNLNIVFFIIFVIFVYLTCLAFTSKGWATTLALAIGLSPLSVYTSLYLPESLFLAVIGGGTYALRRAIESPTAKRLAVVGLIFGLSTTVKPHGFLSVMGIAIFFVVFALFTHGKFLRRIMIPGIFALSALAGRVVFGILFGGPTSLNIFEAYGAGNALREVAQTRQDPVSESNIELVGAGQVQGAIGLFPVQLEIHLITAAAIAGPALALVLSLLLTPSKSTGKAKEPVVSFVLAIFIWFFTLLISIVLFTGWVTGAGDDHSSRVLLRYYDFGYALLAVAAVSIMGMNKSDSLPLLPRWLASIPIFAASTIAFSGFFPSLTIQIADAPFLAGLVVNQVVFESLSIGILIVIGTLAFFPRLLNWALTPWLIFSLVATGFQSQDQYLLARGQEGAADQAGKLAKALIPSGELESSVVVSTSRFDGRIVSFWMDTDNRLEIRLPGEVVDSGSMVSGTNYIILQNEIGFDGEFELVSQTEAFSILKVEID